MRPWLALALVLLAVSSAGAQSIADQLEQQAPKPAGLPAQSFTFFKCLCNTSAGAPLANALSLAPPAPRQWTGSVYATSARDANFKARNACTAERRSGLFDCIDCRCDR